MTFKEFYLLESDRIGLSKIDPENPDFTVWGGRIVSSLKNNDRAVVGFWKHWGEDGPGYHTRIDFPDSTHQGPRASTREELYPWIEKTLTAKGYDTSTFREARSSMIYHGWPDEETMTSQPEYDPEVHIKVAEFGNKLGGVVNQAQYQINNPDEFNVENSTKTFYHATTKESASSLLKNGFNGTPPKRNYDDSEFYRGERADKLFVFDNLEDAAGWGFSMFNKRKADLAIVKIELTTADDEPIEDRLALGRAYMIRKVASQQIKLVPPNTYIQYDL